MEFPILSGCFTVAMFFKVVLDLDRLSFRRRFILVKNLPEGLTEIVIAEFAFLRPARK
jgi:hypothetical protein